MVAIKVKVEMTSVKEERMAMEEEVAVAKKGFFFFFFNSKIYSAVCLKQSMGSIYLLAINTMPT